MPSEEKKRIAVIGAGPAGLTAAWALSQQEDCDVTVFEQSEAFGGISRTVQHGGNRMDIGGHRFFSKSQEVCELWGHFMPVQGAPALDDALLGREKPLNPGGPDPQREDRVMLVRERVSRIYYLKKFFDYPISLKWQTIKNLGFVRMMKAGFSYLAAMLHKLPETSLENFYINRFGRELYSMFFEKYTEKLWGRHPSEISADWGAQRVKGLSVIAVVKDMFAKLFGKKSAENTETSLIEQFIYPKFGPGQLWETVAAEAEKSGVKIEKNARVSALTVKNGRIASLTVEGGVSREIEADYVLSSMPIKDLVGSVRGDMPGERIAQLAADLPYRDFVTVGLLVNRLALVNDTGIKTLANIVPDCWIYVQDAGVTLGRIQVFNNWSPYMVADPEHTVWVGLEYFCAEGDEFWCMDDGERLAYAMGELKRMGVLEPDCEALDSHCERVPKAYPAYFDSYANIDEIVEYLDSIENLACIGRNGQHRYNNMDHSMLTALRAADWVLGSADRAAVWNVNTESEYHEQKES